jgi:hypothetical protein
LEKLLLQKKDQILQLWIKAALASYPAETARFLKRERDQFNNPVGHSIASNLNILMDALLDPDSSVNLQSALDGLIRIRSVQDFTASEAVAFVFALKSVVFEELQLDRAEPELIKDWLTFEKRIDRLALFAFDTFMKCRDDLAEVRIKDIKRRSHLFMQNFQCPGNTAREEEEKKKSFDGSLKGEDAQ